MSEHNPSQEQNRIQMVREADGKLVPVLLSFLQRCERSSSEQYLTLLVLNNISIPCENKRLIAIDYEGAIILSRLLCEDPSCHVMCIILANLAFSDGNLRKQLTHAEASINLLHSFGYTLRIALLPPEKQHNIKKIHGRCPRELLTKVLFQHPLQLQHINSDDDSTTCSKRDDSITTATYSYPETVRWCLCGMKSLTRPCRDPFAAHALLQSGILPIILNILDIPHAENCNGIVTGTIKPHNWESHSIYDSALYILFNLSITPSARLFLRKNNATKILRNVASYSSFSNTLNPLPAEEKQKDIQCLKARMSLAFLLGSEGHFGQGKGEKKSIDSSDLLTKGSEAPLLVELATNSLHCRGKDGPGGYSAATFNAKKTLFAIRCLLTNHLNVKTFYVTCGVKLNALLFKAVALHAVQLSPMVDVEAAEDACFALYLLSSYGFMGSFLPNLSAGQYGNLFEKVLVCYSRKVNITKTGKHAATQLLLRSPYLNFDGELDRGDEPSEVQLSDFEFNQSLINAAESVEIDVQVHGAKPLDDVFGRPVMRRSFRESALSWEDDDTVVSYPSALEALQDLSLGNSCIIGEIDDIVIANNIVNSANGGQSELYGYEWSWLDDGLVFDRDIQQRLRELRSGNLDSVRGMISKVRQNKFMNSTEPLSLFGFKCGCGSVD